MYRREPYDFYIEESWPLEKMLEQERPFTGLTLDPCCGIGTVPDTLHAAGIEAVGADIILRDPRFRVGEFHQVIEELRPVNIVSNPPYNAAEDFIKTALQHTQDRVCVFLRQQFLESDERTRWLEISPLARVWICADRVMCVPGSIRHEKQKKSGGAMAFAWYVFEQKYSGRPAIGWLRKPDHMRGKKALKRLKRQETGLFHLSENP